MVSRWPTARTCGWWGWWWLMGPEHVVSSDLEEEVGGGGSACARGPLGGACTPWFICCFQYLLPNEMTNCIGCSCLVNEEAKRLSVKIILLQSPAVLASCELNGCTRSQCSLAKWPVTSRRKGTPWLMRPFGLLMSRMTNGRFPP